MLLAVQPLFVEVAVVPSEFLSSASVVEVVLRNGHRLEVRADFDEAEVQRVVALLESMPC